MSMQNGARHFEYRTRVAVKVARLADLLEQWEDWDVDQLLSPMERTLAKPPMADRQALAAVHHALLTELHEMDAVAPAGEWRVRAAA